MINHLFDSPKAVCFMVTEFIEILIPISIKKKKWFKMKNKGENSKIARN